MCSLFLRRGGTIGCTVTGQRKYSADLPQGGLEIPWFLVFKATPKEIQKLKMWKHMDFQTYINSISKPVECLIFNVIMKQKVSVSALK